MIAFNNKHSRASFFEIFRSEAKHSIQRFPSKIETRRERVTLGLPFRLVHLLPGFDSTNLLNLVTNFLCSSAAELNSSINILAASSHFHTCALGVVGVRKVTRKPTMQFKNVFVIPLHFYFTIKRMITVGYFI